MGTAPEYLLFRSSVFAYSPLTKKFAISIHLLFQVTSVWVKSSLLEVFVGSPVNIKIETSLFRGKNPFDSGVEITSRSPPIQQLIFLSKKTITELHSDHCITHDVAIAFCASCSRTSRVEATRTGVPMQTESNVAERPSHAIPINILSARSRLGVSWDPNEFRESPSAPRNVLQAFF